MKKNHFEKEPPTVEQLSYKQANALILELWNKLREYEDRLSVNSRNAFRSPSSNSPAARDARKNLNTLAAEVRWALNLAKGDIKDQ
ncbi:DUF6444 domain-containing protein [Candidatus Enterovibrio escicola]|uniref:DUF6444 domain-containing protein n=1 Tax=Candidatus Enterovibrio escicola TaxID=1927127 RepID=UPI001CC26F91